MARPKKEQAESEDIGKDNAHDAIVKKHGNVFLNADYFIKRQVETINISPAIDDILGGGIPQGSWVVVTGKEKLGKTTMILSAAADAQKKGMTVYYFAIENRIKARDIVGIEGLDLSPDKFIIVGSSEDGTIMTGEQFLDTLVDLVHSKKNCFFILDSVSQLCSSKQQETALGEQSRDPIPGMLSAVTKRCCQVLPVNRHILVFITHLIANTSGQGMAQYSEASGRKIQYQADVKLKATYKEDYSIGDEPVGQKVHWQCDTNALKSVPHQKCCSLLRYGIGIDKHFDLLQMAKDIGLVEGTTWLTIGEKKLQGMENAVKYLKENPEAYAKLLADFQELTK